MINAIYQTGSGMRKYGRFVTGLRKFINSRMTTQEAIERARSLLKERIAGRESNFISLAERGIFGNSRHPAVALLQAKKIAFADLKRWVVRDGIEAALRALAQDGVYFTVDEFKGKVPVIRNGVHLSCKPEMFDNPFLAHVYEVRSGATRSVGTRVRIDFDYLDQRSLYDAFLLNVHRCLDAPVANWFPIFPSAPGINSSLRFAHMGNPVRRWFSQVSVKGLRVNWQQRWGLKLIFGGHRFYGCPLAPPEYVNLNEALKVAEWAARAIEENGRCVVYTFAASAVRVCAAAADVGLNIAGARFLVTGEPLTPYKRREIEAAGAIAVPVYGISEAGVIAAGCGERHTASDCCHLYKDTTAVINHRLAICHHDENFDSYLFTSLLYESPKLLLNVGMGDFGEISTEDCACEFGAARFDIKLSGIRSYEKLTGEGVTFVDTDIVRIVEELLPSTFGGRSTDYQLVEEEGDRGLTRLSLMVSPRVGLVDENRIIAGVIGCLKKADPSPGSWAQAGTEMWEQIRMLQVRRDFPIPTVSGKILPFHLLKRSPQPCSSAQ